MKLEIDIDKSIKEKKLYPKSKIECYFDIFFYGFIALIFLYFIIVFLSMSNFQLDLGMSIGILIYLIVVPVTFNKLNKIRKFKILTMKDETSVKEFIHNLTNESKWKIYKENDKILIIQTNSILLNNRQLTFIFSNENIFINVMSFGLGDIISPLYYSYDLDFLEKIIVKMKESEIVQ